MHKRSRANLTPVRQRTQYTCMATSMMMCLQSQGIECDEDEVADVMGCKPMRGATWEDAIACAQHYGMRAVLICPATVATLKRWTDQGDPVMVAWNPEGRDWSHASVVFDVTEEDGITYVHVADPNIPNPTETVRKVPEDQFYSKWSEKWPQYLVRRPAMAVMREITEDGMQVVAKSSRQVVARFLKASVDPPYKQDNKPIYPKPIDHGYNQPLSGGWDIMKRLQDQLVQEQGRPDWDRPDNPRLGMMVRRVVARHLNG
jgi:hypothetical protein